jgi:hypothetical protein
MLEAGHCLVYVAPDACDDDIMDEHHTLKIVYIVV